MTPDHCIAIALALLGLVALAVGLAIPRIRRAWACALGSLSVFGGGLPPAPERDEVPDGQ